MKKLFLLVVLLVLLAPRMRANMASPLEEGSLFSSPFISEHVTILSEHIRVQPQPDFTTARYFIEYRLEVDSTGTQIPLLFYAMDYEEDFQIALNGEALIWQPVPPEYTKVVGTRFREFAQNFPETSHDSSEDRTTIYWNEYGGGTVVRPSDLFFFETDLLPGEHTVRVEYVATYWKDRSDWVNKYSFRYSLSPARYWKAIQELTIEVDASKAGVPLTTNLGAPTGGSLDSVAIWHFDTIPVPEFWVEYQPEITPTARLLIRLGPWGITTIVCGLLILLHYWLQIRYRRRHPDRRLNPLVWILGVLVPLLSFFIFMGSFNLIDMSIGAEASNVHGYASLSGFIFVLLLVPYLLLAWLVDRYVRKISR